MKFRINDIVIIKATKERGVVIGFSIMEDTYQVRLKTSQLVKTFKESEIKLLPGLQEVITK